MTRRLFPWVLLLLLLVGCEGAVHPLEAPEDTNNPKKEGIEPVPLHIHLDFEEGYLLYDPICPSDDLTDICFEWAEGPYPGFAVAEIWETRLTTAVWNLFSAFDVSVSSEPSGDEDIQNIRVVLNPELHGQGPDESAIGTAWVDCGNRHDQEAVLVMHEPTDPIPNIAVTVAHEVGHALGLSHQERVIQDVMWPTTGKSRQFLDACIYTDTEDYTCADDTRAFRCAPRQQNSYQHLMALIGPRHDD